MNSRKYKNSLYDVKKIKNIRELLDASVEKYKDKPAFLVKDKTKKEYVPISFKKLQEDRNALGTSLLNLGLKDKKIAILGENSYYWAMSYFAVVSGVGVVIPIDRELKSGEIANLLKRSGASAIIYSKKLSKVVDEIKEDPTLKGTLTYYINMELVDDEDGEIALNRLLYDGRTMIENGDKRYVETSIDDEKMTAIIFTSGTTGMAKGVMLSHKNLVSNVVNMSYFVKVPEGKVGLSVLPMHHTYEMTCHIMTGLYQGLCIGICEGLKHIQKNMVETKASVMLAVPLIFEMMHKKIMRKAEDAGKYKTLRRMINISKKFKLYNKGNIARKLFKNIHDVTGGNIQQFIAGGASINPKVIEDYEAMGFAMIQGYGMTEVAPIIAVNKDRYSKASSVGLPLPNTEVKIFNEDEKGVGEIICKGPSVMLGYYEDEESTANTIIDGWLHTGDLGYFDEEGFLYVSGRKKSVIVTKNGKNIYPEEVEYYLLESPYILEALVHGVDGLRNDDVIIKAEIFPDYELFESENIDIENKIQEIIDNINKKAPNYKQIKRFHIRKNEFEKTTTRKIKRHLHSNISEENREDE